MRRRAKSGLSNMSECSDSVPKEALDLVRRPKFPFHFAVTLALKNARKEYASMREISNFIHKYIPGWKFKTPSSFTQPRHYNAKVHVQEGVRYCLRSNSMHDFDKRINRLMEQWPDRNSWEYGLADPDDWEPMLRGKLETAGIFARAPTTPFSPPTDIHCKAVKKALFGEDQIDEPDEEKEKAEDIKDVKKAKDINKLELRWIFDMAVLHNGNRLACSNIFGFVTKNFPEYRRCHQWKQELLDMVAMGRMKSVKEVLDWQTHYIVSDNEIREFKKFISEFIDRNPDGAVGLDPSVKWDDLFPFELITCINTYLESTLKMKEVKKKSNDQRPEFHQEKTPETEEYSNWEGCKHQRKRVSGNHRTPSLKRTKKTGTPHTPTEWTITAARNFTTSSNERAARVARRRTRQSDVAPVYDRPNPSLPRPTTVTHVEDAAFVPLNSGELGSEMGSPFDGVFVPQEFITMSSDIMKSLPGGTMEDNEFQEFPSDLEGIEPAHLLDNTIANNNSISDEPSMYQAAQEEGNTEDGGKKDEEDADKEPAAITNDSFDAGEVSLTATPMKSPSQCTITDCKSNLLFAVHKDKVNIKREQDMNESIVVLASECSRKDFERESSIECLGFRKSVSTPAKNDRAQTPSAIDYDSDIVELDCY